MSIKTSIAVAIFSFSLFYSPLSLAVEHSPENSLNDSIRVLEIEAHDLMHDDDHVQGVAAKLKSWAQKLNVPEFLLRQRLLARKGGATGSEHLQNLALLLGTSHLIEMSSGPLGASIAAAMDAPTWVTAGIGVAGGIISIPGFDPLCIGLFALYSHEGFRNGVTSVRLFLTSWKQQTDAFAAGYELIRQLQKSGRLAEGNRLILNVLGEGHNVDVLLTIDNSKVEIEALRLRYDHEKIEYADRHVHEEVLPWELRRIIRQLGISKNAHALFYVERKLGNGWYKMKREYLSLRDKEVASIFSCKDLLSR